MEINQTLKEKDIPLFFTARVKRCICCSYLSSIWFTVRPWSYCDYGRHAKDGGSGSQHHNDDLLGRY